MGTFFILSFSILLLAGCDKVERANVLIPDGSQSFMVMNFNEPMPLDPLPEGWYHRTFWFHPPMDISFVKQDQYPSIKLSTDDSASMLFRYVDVQLDEYPMLSWDWFIEKGVVSDISGLIEEGDDHPARIFLAFENIKGEKHRMEIVWGNRELHRGDWKHIKFSEKSSFPHYVANGGEENIGRWFHENVDLTKLYAELWGNEKGVRLTDIALFCDTDNTGAESIAYFSNIKVEKNNP